MSTRLIALKDVLGALEQAGPLSSDALARRLRLNRLDARLVLVDAHAHGLVRANSRGDWAITHLGREALTMDLADDHSADRQEDSRWSATPYLQRLRAFASGARWREVLHPRYLARRGVPLALGTIVCAGGVAVASSRLESSAGGPVLPAANTNAAAHGRHANTHGARHLIRSGVVSFRRHRHSSLVSTTGPTRALRGHLVRQSPRHLVAQCRQHHGTTTSGGRLTTCTTARRTRPHSPTGGGSRGAPSQRVPQNTDSGGSGARFTVSPTAGA
jgi:hypothetical protein